MLSSIVNLFRTKPNYKKIDGDGINGENDTNDYERIELGYNAGYNAGHNTGYDVICNNKEIRNDITEDNSFKTKTQRDSLDLEIGSTNLINTDSSTEHSTIFNDEEECHKTNVSSEIFAFDDYHNGNITNKFNIICQLSWSNFFGKCKCGFAKICTFLTSLNKSHKLLHLSSNPNELKLVQNSWYELFMIGLGLIKSVKIFMLVMFLSEGFGLLSTWALFTENILLIILAPITTTIASYLIQDYLIRIHFEIREGWKKIVFEYFNNLSYQSRKKSEMSDYNSQVERTGFAIIYIVCYGFSTAIRIGIMFINCVVAFYIQKQMYFVIMYPLLFALYYFMRMSKKQETMTGLRKIKKDIEKKIKPIMYWSLHLFQNRKRSVSETIGIEQPIHNAERDYIIGWEKISKELLFFADILSSVSLYVISPDIKTFLINKVIFNQLTNSIENVGHLTNSIANQMKEFDRFIDWVKSCELDPMKPQECIVFPIKINAHIELKQSDKEDTKTNSSDSLDLLEEKTMTLGKFILDANELTISSFDKILLRGESGIGKTQLVNAIQGLISGAKFIKYNWSGSNASESNISESDYIKINDKVLPETYESNWEYMNQQTRETIPSFGLSLRQMLEDESDDDLIMRLVCIVMLEDKFNLTNLDTPMEGISGGEKMRLSILYTLWNMEKRNKQVLILDEPEQGLDEDIRVSVIKNILTYVSKPVLVIYHGSRLDLLQLPFTKVWIFDKVNVECNALQTKQTKVMEKTFKVFKNDLLKEINAILEK